MNERYATVTERLYETDAAVMIFTAAVLSCETREDGFAVVLDRTAFFPTGGGQAHDEGTLDGAEVRDVVIEEDRLLHLTDRYFAPGQTVTGRIDAALRRRRMACHTGEHLVSAVMEKRFGLHNVGFHLGSRDVTCDFDGIIDKKELAMLEDEVNVLIREDHPVTARCPAPDELASLTYRSKLALTGPVRIVFIGRHGEIDRCACCAPHAASTGEIGALRIREAEPYKGGLRLHLSVGADAVAESRRQADCLSELSALLSAKPEGEAIVEAVKRISRETERMKTEIERLNDALNDRILSSLTPDGPVCLFDGRSDRVALRKLASEAEKRSGYPAAVVGAADPNGERPFFLVGSAGLKPLFEELKARLPIRGGGSDRLISGNVAASDGAITAAWRDVTGH